MTQARKMAVGGMLAALAVVIMCLGTLIPVATFVCPILCMLLLHIVARLCTRRVGWAWYVGVSILCALFAPDKEAAAVFVFLGYYPLVKPALEKLPLSILWKLCLFNGAIAFMYGVLIYVLGMGQIAAEYQEAGVALLAVLLLMGNLTFFILDKLLTKMDRKSSGR